LAAAMVAGESLFRQAQPGKPGVQNGDSLGCGFQGRRVGRDGLGRRRQQSAAALVAPVSSAATRAEQA